MSAGSTACRRAAAIAAFLLAARTEAHERFIKHTLKQALDSQFFINVKGQGLLGVNRNIWIVTTNGFFVLSTFLMVWFCRQPIEEFITRRLLGFLRGAPQRALHHVACFLTDRPVRSKAFHTFGQWAVVMFLRSPALVLMYSATNDSLVMPSYPLDPASAVYFKFAQVALALLILTQTMLPLCGALILGTWLYLNRWGFMVGVDAVPVLTVAVVYLSSPWNSHRLALTSINRAQMRWVRLVLGVGFFALGWLKIYNHNLIAAVADNYPSVLHDPASLALARGADVANYKREIYCVAFGLAEVLTGFMVMMGIFTRVWTAIMVFVFTKLMLFDFGFEEIPHIYPISACLTVMFSNHLTSELDPIERVEEALGRQGRPLLQALLVVGFSLGVSFLLVYPAQYLISLMDRSSL